MLSRIPTLRRHVAVDPEGLPLAAPPAAGVAGRLEPQGPGSETGQRKLAFGVLADWYEARSKAELKACEREALAFPNFQDISQSILERISICDTDAMASTWTGR